MELWRQQSSNRPSSSGDPCPARSLSRRPQLRARRGSRSPIGSGRSPGTSSVCLCRLFSSPPPHGQSCNCSSGNDSSTRTCRSRSCLKPYLPSPAPERRKKMAGCRPHAQSSNPLGSSHSASACTEWRCTRGAALPLRAHTCTPRAGSGPLARRHRSSSCRTSPAANPSCSRRGLRSAIRRPHPHWQWWRCSPRIHFLHPSRRRWHLLRACRGIPDPGGSARSRRTGMYVFGGQPASLPPRARSHNCCVGNAPSARIYKSASCRWRAFWLGLRDASRGASRLGRWS
mmetsp:Transcript_7105/g.17024  ORF Transcript_7105/g.17024 Transcript_7105/m.17024 type:complete len:286 (-) Transcript_7105:16-873(-)